MSLSVQLLECELCKTTVYAFPMLPSVYVFTTGELARLRWTFGWCNDCRDIRQVENLPTAESLDKEEADLHSLARSRPDGLDRYEQKDLERIGLYRRLLSVRHSGCRCMDCGGSNIEPWKFDAQGQTTYSPHGDCAGKFRPIEDPDGMRLSLIEDAKAYSLEGEYLGRLSEQPGCDGSERF